MPPFHENSTLADVELGELIAQLRSELKARGVSPGLVNITQYNWSDSSKSHWIAVALVENGGTVAGQGKLLHEALNELLAKVAEPPDLAAILGYQEVSGPLEFDDVPR